MVGFDPHQIANLVGQLGGDHQQAAQQLSNLGGGQVDPQQHADVLQQMGVDPQQLQNGGYDQHLDNQNQPGFQGYQAGSDLGQQSPQFDDQSQQGGQGGYGDPSQQQGGGYDQAGQQNF